MLSRSTLYSSMAPRRVHERCLARVEIRREAAVRGGAREHEEGADGRDAARASSFFVAGEREELVAAVAELVGVFRIFGAARARPEIDHGRERELREIVVASRCRLREIRELRPAARLRHRAD